MPVEEQYYTQARVANKYDAYIGKNIPFYWPALGFIADKVGEHFKGRKNLEVFDIGCGTANHCITVSRKIDIGRLTLVDHSSAILKVAQQKVEDAGSIRGSVHVKHASFLDDDWLSDIEPGSVDLILSSLTLDHITKDEEFLTLLGKLGKVLRNDGCFVMCEKCASPEKSSGSWQSVAQMLHIRGENNRRNSFKTEAEIEEWKKHNFEEDILRPLASLWSMAEQAGFEVFRAGGAVLPDAAELDYERFYSIDQISLLDRDSVFNRDVGYGAGILVCVKRARNQVA